MQYTDKLRVNFKSKSLIANLKVFIGKDGDYWVGIIPSLNISSYSDNEKDLDEALRDALDIYVNDLFSLTESQFYEELNSLGFKQDSYFKKKFSKSYVDENGILQNFDNPESVKKENLNYA